ncbi:MAG: hypothetical protein OXN27_18170 [Candidatus Poribacteria bacterium]|nr:hypothetical protein [Candidatus Poribacteria bacterium]
MRHTHPRELQVYQTPNEREPFTEWFESIQNQETQDIIQKMGKLRTWRAYLTERFAANPEAAIRYLKFSLEEYQIDRDTPLLLLALRSVVESQDGISGLAKKTGIAPEVLSNILTSDEVPRIDTLGTILNALGCRLLIESIADTDHRFKSKCEEGTDVNAAVEKDIEQVVEPHLS